MPREATLFDESEGSCVGAYFALRQDGGNIPPAWIDRSRASRRRRQLDLAPLLQAKSLDAVHALRDWELALRRESLYLGLRVLLELERTGKSDL